MKGGNSLSFYRLQRGRSDQRVTHSHAQRPREVHMPLKRAGFDRLKAYLGRISLFSMLHRFAAGFKPSGIKKGS